MTSACSFIFMQIKVIFIRMVSHLDSLWNRGLRELGDGLLKYYLRGSSTVFRPFFQLWQSIDEKNTFTLGWKINTGKLTCMLPWAHKRFNTTQLKKKLIINNALRCITELCMLEVWFFVFGEGEVLKIKTPNTPQFGNKEPPVFYMIFWGGTPHLCTPVKITFFWGRGGHSYNSLWVQNIIGTVKIKS